MIRRYRTPLVALTAMLGLVGSVRASGMATFQLINTDPVGTAPIKQVVATILPAGSVPDGTNPSLGNPFNVISGSSGFNVTNLVDYLGTGTNSSNQALEVIKLQFDAAGFSPGGIVNFSLALDPSYTGPPPTLVLPIGTTGLSLLSYTPPGTPTTGTGSDTGSGTTTGGTTTSPPTTQVPEPISLAFWSAAVGLGLLRARAFRRARSLVV